MRCKKVQKWLSDAIDGELGEKRQEVLRRHLEKCSQCQFYAGFLRKIQESAHSWESLLPPSEYWQNFQSRLFKRISYLGGEERKHLPLLLRWKWAWMGAGILFLAVLSGILFLSSPRPSSASYVFSFEEAMNRVYQKIGGDLDLEETFNHMVLVSLEEEIGSIPRESLPGLFDDPLLFKEWTEEEMKIIESVIKRETRS